MKDNIINKLNYAKEKKKNCVLGYMYCDYLLNMFKEIERLKEYMRNNLEVNEHNEYIVYIGTNEDDLSKIIGSDDNE